MTKKIIIVGGGPAGLSAAINAASEGIAVTLLDKANALGGQFHESNDIENFPGVPMTNGPKLSAAMIEQAKQFGVEFQCPMKAAKLVPQADGSITVITEEYEELKADAVVLALGLSWRRLDATGVPTLMGRGVTYGAAPKLAGNVKTVMIVGGGNSAGQQAVKMAQIGKQVIMVVRKTLDAQMSTYLINQIRALPNIDVRENSEIAAARGRRGDGWLNAITLKGSDGKSDGDWIDVQALMIYIGAIPHTLWISDQIELDAQRFIKTDDSLNGQGLFETSIPGVFAIGDARSGSCKRIGAAVGEGSTVVPEIHKYLAKKEIKNV